LTIFPETFRRPEALQQVLKWIRDWPFPLETKKQALSFWAETYAIHLTVDQWHYAIPEEIQHA
jgi:hypothetical protein